MVGDTGPQNAGQLNEGGEAPNLFSIEPPPGSSIPGGLGEQSPTFLKMEG